MIEYYPLSMFQGVYILQCDIGVIRIKMDSFIEANVVFLDLLLH